MVNKIVFLGDSGSGKSSIVERFINNTFHCFQEPTIGASFFSFNRNINRNLVNFQIWDTAGQERYRSLSSMYYRGCNFAVIVFDLSLYGSFDSVKIWIDELNEKKPDCIKIIVGNKVDLKIAVDQRIIANYMNENRMEYFEVSAKTGENVNNIFDYISKNANFTINSNRKNILCVEKENYKFKKDCCIIL